jgi:hypothetical protein
VCRDYAGRQGFEVVAVFSDRAVTGATRHGRAGIGRLLEAAAAGGFDLMIAETMSRVGRDEEDRAAIRKRLTFHGVTIMTPVDGVVTRLTDGIKAVIDSHYLEDLKVMIRRGMAGVIRDGRHAGGRAYAYRPVPGKKAEGRMFSSWLKGKGIDPHRFPTYKHQYEDGRIVDARLYPNSLLADFRAHFHEVWLPTRCEAYFTERDQKALRYLPRLLGKPQRQAS